MRGSLILLALVAREKVRLGEVLRLVSDPTLLPALSSGDRRGVRLGRLGLALRCLSRVPDEPEPLLPLALPDGVLVLLDLPKFTDSNGSVFSPPWLAYGVLNRGSNGVPVFSLNCLSGSTGAFLGGVF